MIARDLPTRRGLTLVELMFVSLLMAIIGLALYAGFSNGLRVWDEVRSPFPEEDALIFFDRFSVELSNSLPYPSLDFTGDAGRLSFPTVVSDDLQYPATARGVGAVEYRFDNVSHRLFRTQRTLSDVFRGQALSSRSALEDLAGCVFSYFAIDQAAGQPAWFSEWPPAQANVTAGLPLAVRAVLVYISGNKTEEYAKTVFIPMAQP